MNCIKCGGKMRAKQTYRFPENETVRRRACEKCGHDIYTLEFEIEYTKQISKEIGNLLESRLQKYRKEHNNDQD
jgi:transcriptional regulator NrdR family protein